MAVSQMNMNNAEVFSGALNSEDQKCVGPDSMYVKFISKENDEHYVLRKVAVISETVVHLLEKQDSQGVNAIHFKELSNYVVKKVIEYMLFKINYPDPNNPNYPEFPDDQKVMVELAKAANYFRI